MQKSSRAVVLFIVLFVFFSSLSVYAQDVEATPEIDDDSVIVEVSLSSIQRYWQAIVGNNAEVIESGNHLWFYENEDLINSVEFEAIDGTAVIGGRFVYLTHENLIEVVEFWLSYADSGTPVFLSREDLVDIPGAMVGITMNVVPTNEGSCLHFEAGVGSYLVWRSDVTHCNYLNRERVSDDFVYEGYYFTRSELDDLLFTSYKMSQADSRYDLFESIYYFIEVRLEQDQFLNFDCPTAETQDYHVIYDDNQNNWVFMQNGQIQISLGFDSMPFIWRTSWNSDYSRYDGFISMSDEDRIACNRSMYQSRN